jgi:hypothetical protein
VGNRARYDCCCRSIPTDGIATMNTLLLVVAVRRRRKRIDDKACYFKCWRSKRVCWLVFWFLFCVMPAKKCRLLSKGSTKKAHTILPPATCCVCLVHPTEEKVKPHSDKAARTCHNLPFFCCRIQNVPNFCRCHTTPVHLRLPLGPNVGRSYILWQDGRERDGRIPTQWCNTSNVTIVFVVGRQ